VKIRWLKNCEIGVYESPESINCDEPVIEARKCGDEDDVDVVAYGSVLRHGKVIEDKSKPQLQFGDGSITGCVDADWFAIVDPDYKDEVADG
jgi:hypothetical protein